MKHSVVKLISLNRFFGDFTPIVPYMAIFFAQRGLSTAQISLLFVIWSASILAFEIPTGLLADRVNRKTVLLLARLTKLGCFITWLLFPHFTGFLIGFILWGIATALDSGAFQALIYDFAEGSQDTAAFTPTYGTAMSWSFLGLVFSALLGSFLIQWGFTILIIVASISLAISFAALLRLPRPILQKSPPSHRATKVFSQGFASLRSKRLLIHLLTIGIAAGGIKGAFEEYYSLFFDAKGLTLVVTGIVIASFELMKSIGSLSAKFVNNNPRHQSILVLSIGVLAIASAFAPGKFVIVVLAALTLADAILWILNDSSIQHATSNRSRATIASIKNFGVEALSLVSFFLFTLVTNHFALESIYLLGGLILVIISLGNLLRPVPKNPQFT